MVAAAMTVWVSSIGIPERYVWQGIRYKVSDTPTPLEFDIYAVTHFDQIPTGWRFQGTNEDNNSLIFDVVSFDQGQEWRVLRTYN